MVSLTELRVKIQGVKSIQQITKAMKMIASVRLARLQKRLREAQAFSSRVGSMVGQLLNAQQEELDRRARGRVLFPLPEYHGLRPWVNGGSAPRNPEDSRDTVPEIASHTGWRFQGRRRPTGACYTGTTGFTRGAPAEEVLHPLLREQYSQRVGLVIIAGDKGLCGGYNTSVVHHGLKFIHDNSDKEIHLFTVGRKAQEYVAREALTRNLKVNKVKEYINIVGSLTFVQSEKIADDILARYQALQLSRVVAVFSEAKSLIKHEVQERQLLPVIKPAEEKFFDGILEPDRGTLLGTLIPFYFKTQLYAFLMSAYFSELAARMMTMDNASRNAQELIDGLALELNKVRQDTITRELTEIVGASEAISQR